MMKPKLYLVGGCVRDKIMGFKPKDIDMATSSTPEEVMSYYRGLGYKVYETGLAHGTVTVDFPDLGMVEVTTFRLDTSTDGRNATVEWAQTLEDDLNRRDCSMNAIAFDEETNTYIDPFNGIEDINNGIIRAVGDPAARFKEDYLRVIRLCRFSARFGFHIEEETWKGMVEAAPFVLDHVSIERVVDEVSKAFKQVDEPSDFLGLLNKLGLLTQIFPELEDLKYAYAMVDSTAPSIHWYALGFAMGPLLDEKEFCKRLHLPNDFRDSLITLRDFGFKATNWRWAEAEPDNTVRNFFHYQVGEDLELIRAIVVCHREVMNRPVAMWLFEPATVPLTPIVTGQDLIAEGLTPSKHFGKALKHVMENEQLAGNTNKQELLKIAVRIVKNLELSGTTT